MHQINNTPPDQMTPAQRRAEIASYLAHGVARLRSERPVPSTMFGVESEVLLGFSGEQSVHVNPTNKPEGHA